LRGQSWTVGGDLIGVTVKKGEVELNGAIFDERQRKAAVVAAENVAGVKKVTDGYPKDQKSPIGSNQPKRGPGITFAAQDELPKLPIPDLDRSMDRYLEALRPLQSPREHAETQQAVDEFL